MSIRFDAIDPDYETRVRADFGRQGLMQLLGAELAAVAPGFCEIHLPFRSEVSQQHGYFHAGVAASIADTAGGYAGFTLMPQGSEILTVEFKIHLLAKADGDMLVAVGEVIRPGRTLTVCKFDVSCQKGGHPTHCATGTQTIFCWRSPAPVAPNASVASS